MTTILYTLLIGIAATATMSLFLYALHLSKAVNADMIRAVGSLVTKREDNSLLPGLVTHFISGAFFAFPYAIASGALPGDDTLARFAIGALLGLFHGFIFSFVLIVLVSESHPVDRFRQTGVSVAVAHIGAHIVYGAMVGWLAGVFAIRYGIQITA